MKIAIIIAIALIAGAVGFLLAKGNPFLEYFGSPTVTLINLTGEAISDVTISLGPAKTIIRELQKTQSHTVTIRGRFGESATNVEWTNSEGTHKAIADDYMENYGFYHSTVVLTEAHEAIAIREIKK